MSMNPGLLGMMGAMTGGGIDLASMVKLPPCALCYAVNRHTAPPAETLALGTLVCHAHARRLMRDHELTGEVVHRDSEAEADSNPKQCDNEKPHMTHRWADTRGKSWARCEGAGTANERAGIRVYPSEAVR